MGEKSKIEWTDHTFNPWWGCEKVSGACTFCYAEVWANRWGFNNLWGKNSERRFFGDAHWGEPLKWNAAAEKQGERKRVFCLSMGDICEDRPELKPHIDRLIGLINRTPMLDWLLLTKRPERFPEILPSSWLSSPPVNVWFGTTIEKQEHIIRLDALLKIQNAVYFVSCEPLLGPIDFLSHERSHQIDWIIVGGESGSKARPMHPEWVRGIKEQCQILGTNFFFKQWGEWMPAAPDDPWPMVKAGKSKTGNLIDGKQYLKIPHI